MSETGDDDLPRRWAVAQPRCWRCRQTIAACVCLGVFGLLIVQQDEPDELLGHASADMTMAFASAASSGTASTVTAVSSNIEFPAQAALFNEVTGDEIATQPPMVGRAATARQNVVEPADPDSASGVPAPPLRDRSTT